MPYALSSSQGTPTVSKEVNEASAMELVVPDFCRADCISDPLSNYFNVILVDIHWLYTMYIITEPQPDVVTG